MKATITAGAYFVRIELALEDNAAATEFAKSLPKSLRVALPISNVVNIEARVSGNDANGGINEAGVKRLAGFAKRVDALGAEYELAGGNFVHTIASVEEARAKHGF